MLAVPQLYERFLCSTSLTRLVVWNSSEGIKLNGPCKTKHAVKHYEIVKSLHRKKTKTSY